MDMTSIPTGTSTIAMGSARHPSYFADFQGTFDQERGDLTELAAWNGRHWRPIPIVRGGCTIALAGELLPPTLRPELGEEEALRLAVERHGVEAFSSLNGSFAVLAWDERTRVLHLARDPAGAIPIYYQLTRSRVLFGTSLRLLERHPLFRKDPSAQGVGEFLFFLYIGAPTCIYADTYKVPAGAVLSMHGPRLRTLRYPSPEESRQRISPADAASQVRAVLTDAVRRCLDPARPNIVCLSGGIDSSLIAALASTQGVPLVALTAQYREPRIDESAFAAAIAGHLGIDHERVLVDETRVVPELPHLFEVFDEPLAAINVFALTRAAGLHSAVVLDGSGADGLLGVPVSPVTRYRLLVDPLLPARVRGAVAGRLEPSRLRALRRLGRFLSYGRADDLLAHHNGWRDRDLVRGCSIDESSYYRLYREWKPRTDLFGLYTMLYSTAWGSDEVIPKSAIPGRRLGNVVRFPFEDLGFRATVKRLPRRLKYEAGETKRVLRALLRDHVPPALFERRKQGFGLPIAAILRHGDHQLLREHVDLGAIARRGMIDPRPVRDSLSRFLHGDDGQRHRVWAVLLLEMFLKSRVGC